ncbi:MAG: response regulator [Verrucomicrobia bacterium]|nr:response regulator [Verrucomicrobiota bacterium]
MSKKRILIADDSLTVLKSLEIKLESAGYETSTAVDGSEALAEARRLHPDLVIMDINFPPDINQSGGTWDGFQIIQWMRMTGAAGSAPAIIITSDDVQQHQDSALAAGAAAVFQKPIDIPHLLETIRECLDGHPQAS